MMVLTANTDGAAGNGAAFQYRATTDWIWRNDATSNTTSGAVIAAAVLGQDRAVGRQLTGYVSGDGTTWTMLGTNDHPDGRLLSTSVCA